MEVHQEEQQEPVPWYRVARWIGARVLGLAGMASMLTSSSVPAPIPEIQPLKIVAIGDSFTSGDGLFPYIDGTDQPGVDECHRSVQGYPHKVAEALPESSVDNVACSGSDTTGVETGTKGEKSQLDALGADTDVVLMTDGGNDEMSLGHIKELCQDQGCAKGTDVYNSVQVAIESPRHINKVADLLRKIRTNAKNAKVLFMGYPEPGDLAKSLVTMAAGQGTEEMAAMVTHELNDANQKAIAQVGDSGIIFVPVDVGVGYQTSGEAVFHPDPSGQKRYAQAALRTIRVFFPPTPPSPPR